MQAMASACTYIQSLVVTGRLLSLRQPITDAQVALIASKWGDSTTMQVVYYTSACVILEVASRWGTFTLPNLLHLKVLSFVSGFTPNAEGTEVVLSSSSNGGLAVQKYANLFKEYPLLFIPQDESLPQQQAVVTLALTEAKRSATTEKGDRWCHTPDPLNLIREAGLRGRIPMGVDCKASIPKAGLYLLVPMFGPSWAKGQRLPEEFFSPAVSTVDKHFEPVRYKCTPGVHRVFRLVVSGEFPLKRQFPPSRLVGSLLFS
jgi:hypothetical protein